MKFALSKKTDKKKGDLLVLPFWKVAKKAEPAFSLDGLEKDRFSPVALGDFQGKEGEITFIYGDFPYGERVALLGLGDKKKVSTESLRRSFGMLAKRCLFKRYQDIALCLPEDKALSKEDLVRGVSEGLLLANYLFDKLKTSFSKEDAPKTIAKVTFLGGTSSQVALAEKYRLIADGVYLARDLVNENADEVTPQYLAALSKKLAQDLPSVHATLFDKKRIEKEKLGLLLAVNQGSHRDPFFGILSYKGNPKSKDHTIVVGKGITYDTGGLNLKPTGSMETMKCDMSGAATALGTLYAVASLGMKVNLTVIIASTENSIGPESYKPGDVYVSYLGKSVEIGNTDAEGRLVLADALSYAVKHLHPTRMVNFATLTGAIGVALGSEATGLFSNDEKLSGQLRKAGDRTFERVWPMPLFDEYKEQLKSDIADLKNVGGRSAGSITAAIFLQEFVGKVPWAHCDIASTAYLSEPKKYLPKYATGVGVRLMVEFLESLKD